MIHTLKLVGALALATTSVASFAQMAPMAGTMTVADVGVSPMTGVSATDYVKLAADGDNYEIQSSRIALSKSRDKAVKSFAREMVKDHTATTKSLTAALKNNDRTIAKPSPMLSADNAAKIALLKQAPRASFDQLYIQQQMTSHQTAWSLHAGYAADGTDPSLKQVAATAVPVIERHIAHLKAMPTPGM